MSAQSIDMEKQSAKISVIGHRNIVARTIHIHVLPPLSTRGSVTRARAWAAAGVGAFTGAASAQLFAFTKIAACGVIVGLVILAVVLRGAPGEKHQHQSSFE